MTPSDQNTEWDRPRRTHILSPVVAVVPALKQSIGLVLLAVATGRLWLLAVGAAIAIVIGWLSWFRRTWYFDGETLVREQGLLERQTRRVPVARIQQVELVQPILHRLAGLVTVKVETAGGAAESGVHLDALHRDQGEALRLDLLAARARVLATTSGTDVPQTSSGTVPGPNAAGPEGAAGPEKVVPPPPPPVEVEILTLETPRLMLAGVSSSTLMVVGAVAFAVVDSLADLPESWTSSVEDGAQSVAESLNWLTGLVVFVVLLGAVAALASVLLHHGLTVVRADDELRLWRGWFERKDAVLPLNRIQAVTIRQNPVQRLLGMASVQVRSASGKGTQESLTVPLADRSQIARLVEASTLRPIDLNHLVAAPAASLPRRIGRRLGLLGLPVGAVALLVRPDPSLLVAIGGAAVALATAMGVDAHRNLGFRIDPEHVVVRSGSLLKNTTVVTTTRVQSSRVAASPMQRRVGVCTLVLDLAGIGAQPALIDQTPARCQMVEYAVREASMEAARV